MFGAVGWAVLLDGKRQPIDNRWGASGSRWRPCPGESGWEEIDRGGF